MVFSFLRLYPYNPCSITFLNKFSLRRREILRAAIDFPPFFSSEDKLGSGNRCGDKRYIKTPNAVQGGGARARAPPRVSSDFREGFSKFSSTKAKWSPTEKESRPSDRVYFRNPGRVSFSVSDPMQS